VEYLSYQDIRHLFFCWSQPFICSW